ncbi:MAG: glycosyltransferase [Acidobacteria bacterium]|nr:glycosyltransferase [Acidobacteriota bacterium]
MRTVLAMLRPDSGTRPPRDPTGDTHPRGYLFEEMFAATWDQSLLAGAPASRLPTWLRLAREVYRRQDEYDVVVTWSERLTLALLGLQRLYGTGKPHVALFTQFAKPNLHYPLHLVGRQLHTAFIFSSVQRRFAVTRGLFPAERVFNLHYMVDSQFYQPRTGAEDVIAAVGAEMRDYPTLFAALDGTDLPCHVAAAVVRIPHRIRLIKDRRVPVADLQRTPNPKVSIGLMNGLPGLRDLYARSRFVVVPLLPTQSDNGLTVILEAMAMGKAVIASRTAGQVDAIEDGVTGILVPPGDPMALRAAMLDLWRNPERARAIGARARAQVERHHTVERFCANFVTAFEASMAGTPAPEGWWEAEPLPVEQLNGRLTD